MRNDTVRAKVSHETKIGAEKVLNTLGLSMSEAINLMLIQIRLRKALPFDLSIPLAPNAETVKAIEESRMGTGAIEYDTVESLFKEVEAEINADNKGKKSV